MGEMMENSNLGSTDAVMQLLDRIIRTEGSVGNHLDWDSVEELNGHRFPADYKRFISEIGGGSLEAALEIRLPVATSASDVENRVCRISMAALTDQLTGRWVDEEAGYNLEDLIIWGESAGADTLCWIAADVDPESWPVAVYDRGELAWAVYHCGMAEFILKILVQDFEKCPLSDESLFGMQDPRFLGADAEADLMDRGIDPWA
ncbi:SMI1/KNR4 family protein [Streptomyces sp. NPDC056773]|uniref:SMI1/KNR4 family protein n=1 Tax=unclassified Streptomyces TaxID=2593676 RepID=UPI0036C6B1D4